EMKAGDPAPCAEVDLSGGQDKGFALLKDIVGQTQFLLIPTRRLEGIESPELLAADTPNYWEDAWKARHFVAAAAQAPLTRDDLGLAINSRFARSQSQLHIHLDCVKPRVKQALSQHAAEIGEAWAPLEIGPSGTHYLARRLDGEELSADPFHALAEGVAGARDHMDRETLVVIGATYGDGSPGFYLLSDQTDPTTGDRASGEQLLDHSCALAKGSP
ncbi:MAG TPA: CDP-diacylglycerol diphosphatase, partial [Beijerinckiaceae bacterium]|nr:CDP-diacylglycerol diphosphatase [Beijerinckiaceae bacterium]